MNELEEKVNGLKFGETVFDGRMFYITKTFGGFVYSNGQCCCFVPVMKAEPKTEKSEVKTEKTEAKKVIKK